MERKRGRYGVLELHPRVSSFAPWIRQVLKSRVVTSDMADLSPSRKFLVA